MPSQINYSNNYIAGVCLIPTYLVMAIVLARTSLLIWIVGMIAILLVAGKLYNSVVLQGSPDLGKGKRWLFLFIGQSFFWAMAIMILAYMEK